MRTITSWRLSSHLIREVLGHLDRLAEGPIRHLVRVPPPLDLMMYEFRAYDPDDPNADYVFNFSVLYHADEETLLIVGCDFIRVEDDPEPA